MSRKKLIEVSIPLEAINSASAKEKSIRRANPSTLHLWWSRKPIATTRAVLWASLVDDPGNDSDRQRLHSILAKLVEWNKHHVVNPDTLKAAKAELAKLPQPLPEFLDPFAGGGSIPLEAQRLGLTAHAHDLNPIAVMLNKAMIEIPPKVAGKLHVHPDTQIQEKGLITPEGLSEFADDVKFYGQLLKQKAFAQIGHLYPKIHTPDGDATVIAWLWARTVKCPNPNCKCDMPLVSSFMLSTKSGREFCVVPVIEDGRVSRYEVRPGKATDSPKIGKAKFKCCVCGAVAGNRYLQEQFSAHEDGRVLLAVVAEGKNGRLYLPATHEHVQAADVPRPDDFPDAEMPYAPRYISPPLYDMKNFADLFTNRQLTMLTTFSDLLPEVQEEVRCDALRAGMSESESEEYAGAVRVYLAFAVDKLTDRNSAFCSWDVSRDGTRNTFGRQAIPMVWDFAEANPFCDSSGSFTNALDWVVWVLEKLPGQPQGSAEQHDAQMLDSSVRSMIVSTDPPYYDNIGYADLSDYFYIWMRRNLRDVYPELFRRVLVPKSEELIATPYRHEGSPKKAREYFESGMQRALQNVYQYACEEYPVTIYYAYKQKESDSDGESSAGWETMLNAVISAGFQVTGTWPIRTELTNRALALGTNALASSVVLVCRKRPKNAGGTTKERFDEELAAALKSGLDELRSGNIAPVDVPQAAIGKGIAVYSQYSRIVDTDGNVLSVRDVLRQINRLLDPEAMELDDESRFCVELYTLAGFDGVVYDDAVKIATRLGISVDAVRNTGAVSAEGGTARLTERELLKIPDKREKWEGVGVWRCAQILTQAMSTGGNDACAVIVSAVGKGFAERARDLVYRLYLTAERRGMNSDMVAYNSLILSWPEILRKVEENKRKGNNEVRYQFTLGLEESSND